MNDSTSIVEIKTKEQKKRDFDYSAFGRLIANPAGVIGGIIVLVFIIIAVFSSQLMPYDPIKNFPKDRLQSPSGTHWAGTDEMGRDVFSRLMKGASNSISIALVSVAFAGIIGTILGAIGGYFGGWFDNLVQRFMDLIFSFPTMLLALAIATALGTGFIDTVMAIGIVYLPIFSRTARGAVLQIREMEYVEAAVCLGLKDSRIIFRHILPNAMAPLVVQVSLGISWAILTESSLSYLGLGTQPPIPSWGAMLSQARVMMELAPWLVVAPGVTIMLSVLGFNLLGDAVRDLMDPAYAFKRNLNMKQTNPEIRMMTNADELRCAEIMAGNELWQRYHVTFASALDRFQKALAGGASVLVAEVDGKLSGFCWYHEKAAFNRSGYIQLIGVDPSCKGLGIGKALLQEAESRVKKVSDDMFLTVSDFNTDAQAFYLKLGYNFVGEIPDYVLPGISEKIMRKRLKND